MNSTSSRGNVSVAGETFNEAFDLELEQVLCQITWGGIELVCDKIQIRGGVFIQDSQKVFFFLGKVQTKNLLYWPILVLLVPSHDVGNVICIFYEGGFVQFNESIAPF